MALKITTNILIALIKYDQKKFVKMLLNDIKMSNEINWNLVITELKSYEMFDILKIFFPLNEAIRYIEIPDEELYNALENLNINWTLISTYQLKYKPIEFIRKNKDKIDFRYYLTNYTFTEEMIREFYDYLDNDILTITQKVPLDILNDKWNEFNLDLVSYYQKLNTDFILQHADELNFPLLLLGGNITEEIIKDPILFDKISINQVIKYVNLSEEFLTKKDFYFNWKFISYYQTKLKEEFLEIYNSILNFDMLSERQELSEEFIKKYKNKLNGKLVSMKSSNNISESFIELNKDFFDGKMISKYKKNLSEDFILRNKQWLNIDYLLLYQELSENIIEKLILSPLQWKILSGSQKNLSEEFVTKYFNKLDKFLLAKYQKNLSEEFFMNNIDKFSVNDILFYQENLSENFFNFLIEKNLMNWTALSMRKDLTETFINTNSDKINMDLLNYIKSH
jgi:hypothetical protein